LRAVGTGKRRVHGIGSGGIDNPRIALVDRPDIAYYADEWDLGAALVARGFGVARSCAVAGGGRIRCWRWRDQASR